MCFVHGMKFTVKYVIGLVVVMLMGNVLAGGDKPPAVSISFHLETEANDHPKMIFPYEIMGKQKFFRRLPEISAKDFVAYSPFPSEDQTSYGLVLQIKDNARRRLAAITQNSSGKWLICHAYGRVVDGVLIEDPVDDGVIVVWKGITLEEIRLMDKTLPRIGEKKK